MPVMKTKSARQSRGAAISNKLNRLVAAQECDATGDHSSTTAGYI